MLRRPLIGLVALSSDDSLVGTITSAGTDVIDMSASNAGSTVGVAAVVVAVDVVGASLVEDVGADAATVVGASVEAIDVAVGTGALGEVAAASDVAPLDEHDAVASARATTHRVTPMHVCDLIAPRCG